ncbi:RNA-binding protein [bacterium]|jgi:RNA recognition motif-containing protein|nr:RNA-binding protein [bacterium]NBX72364.1 RNA-binding protein [bacterium]
MKNDQNNKVHLGNLSFKTDKETIMKEFGQCGTITEISLPVDRETGKSRGFAFITFETAAAQKSAIEKNGIKLDGRMVKVSEARPSTNGSTGPRTNNGYRSNNHSSYQRDSYDDQE